MNRAKRVERKLLSMIIALALVLPMVCAVWSAGIVNVAAAQEDTVPDFNPIKGNTGYSSVLYDNTNGLPTSEANAIAQTAEGFIWIGSYGGLVRYDGVNFKRIESPDYGITGVRCLFVDKKDRLWIGTTDNGVTVMDKGEFRHWGENEGLLSSSVFAVAEDEKGLIYISAGQGVAVIDENMDLRTLSDERIRELFMSGLKVGADGLVYCLSQTNDVFTLRDGEVVTFLSHEDMSTNAIISLLPDPEEPGKVYMGTNENIVYHGALSKSAKDYDYLYVTPLHYSQNIEYAKGMVWACSDNGVGVFDGKEIKQLKNIPMTDSVTHVMEDSEGNLWFTSSRQGVMKVVPNRFVDIFERYGLDKAVVNSTCIYEDKLFIGTDNGLRILDKNGNSVKVPIKVEFIQGKEDLEAFMSDSRIRSVISDSSGRLWISTFGDCGLVCYKDGVVIEYYSRMSGLLSERTRAVCELSNGSVAVAETGGVTVITGDPDLSGENSVILQNNTNTKSYGAEDGIKNIETLTVCEGQNGDLLLGSDGGGIYVINDSGVRNIGKKDGLTSGVVMRIKRDRTRDIYWLITGNSIAYLDAEYNVHTIKTFPYSNNFDIYQNSKDEAWILSSNGIYVLPTQKLIDDVDISPMHYDLSNGMPYITTVNSYSELTDEGDLYISGNMGVIKVNIEEEYDDNIELGAAVPYVEADGKRIYPDSNGSFNIPYYVKKLTIYSFVLNYSLTSLKVSYHLKGFDDSVTTVAREAIAPIDYTNLHGGEYTFIMELTSPRQDVPKALNVRIIKERAFYEQVWFYIVAAVVLILLLIVLIRLYLRVKLRNLEKKQRESMMFVHEVTEAFAKVIDMKDAYTNGHSSRVAKYTVMLAKELGCDEETTEKYYYIALLHDIGKVGVPSSVLNKPGKLTDEEFTLIKSHAQKGYEALKGISIMPELALGAQSHHERPDGKGYPNHLSGPEIPRAAQIIAVADCFDAMYSNRPYRKRMNFEKAVSIIKEASGSQLTPDVVDAFLRLVDKGEFRAPDDHGGGTTENIENIRSS